MSVTLILAHEEAGFRDTAHYNTESHIVNGFEQSKMPLAGVHS